MTGNETRTSSGVILVVDYHSHLPPAVEVAIALANRRRLALRGLFVEDPDLASVSSLPFSQEVTLLSARPRALEAERLNRTLQGFSRRFRQLLSQGAERASLEYSFGSVQGRRQAIELCEEQDIDYLVLGQPGPLRDSKKKVLRVLLVEARMEAALPVLESLRSLVEARELELLCVGGEDKPGEERLQAFIADHREVSCQRLQAAELANIFRPVGDTPDLVITSRSCNAALLTSLLKLASCPVIISA